MSTPNNQPNRPSFADRVAALQNAQNLAVVCEKCGSSWFTELVFNQYSGDRYATVPGGELQIISTVPQTIRVCICGNPIAPNIGGIRPGRLASQEVGSFIESLRAAKGYRNTTTNPVPADYLSREEYQTAEAEEKSALDLRLNQIEGKVSNLEGQLTFDGSALTAGVPAPAPIAPPLAPPTAEVKRGPGRPPNAK